MLYSFAQEKVRMCIQTESMIWWLGLRRIKGKIYPKVYFKCGRCYNITKEFIKKCTEIFESINTKKIDMQKLNAYEDRIGFKICLELDLHIRKL